MPNPTKPIENTDAPAIKDGEELNAFRMGAAQASDDPEAAIAAIKQQDDQSLPPDEPELDAEGNPIEKLDDENDDGEADPEKKPDAKKEGEQEEGEDEADPEAVAKQKIEDEIATLQLKTKAADRFRELSGRAARADELESQLAQATAAAQGGEEVMDAIESTGASGEQFAAVLTYLQLINSRDPAKMKTGYDLMQKELTWLSKEIGVEAPGYDPLDEYPDLKAMVEENPDVRAMAVETARLRKLEKNTTTRSTEVDNKNREDEQFRAGVAAAKQFGETMRKTDPDFQHKLGILSPLLDGIYKNAKPAEWAARIKEVYDKIPAPVKPRVTAPRHMPLRPTGTRASGVVETPTDELSAFRLGVKMANEGNG